MTSEAASQTSPKGFSLADIFKPFQLPISKVSSSDVLKALGKFLPVHFQKGVNVGLSGCPYHIGDFAQGGVIIWLTNDGLHGLVAAIEDAKDGNIASFKWSTTLTATNATNNDPLPFSTPTVPYGQYYGGYKNQKNSTIQASLDNYPAFKVANNYSYEFKGKIYDDWWLPSSRELSLIYAAVDVINQVSVDNGGSAMVIASNSIYWSSLEANSTNAWNRRFNNGEQFDFIKNTTNIRRVRCVRAF